MTLNERLAALYAALDQKVPGLVLPIPLPLVKVAEYTLPVAA